MFCGLPFEFSSPRVSYVSGDLAISDTVAGASIVAGNPNPATSGHQNGNGANDTPTADLSENADIYYSCEGIAASSEGASAAISTISWKG